jgi:hypothetical protein
MILNEAMLADELQRKFNRNVFVMMRYRSDSQFANIENALKISLAKYGLIARLAKDCAFSDDLWENIQLYMKFSRLGIVVFEEINERDFNPNISLELGYMYALGRRCLLLKDKRMPRLPTDTCGKIYRDFDTYDLTNSIEIQISEWCERDLGLSRISIVNHGGPEIERLVYDSNSEDKSFRAWGAFSSLGTFSDNIKLIDNQSTNMPGESQAVQIKAGATESAGLNKGVFTIWGKVKFDYQAIQSSASVLNLYFCVIPMQMDPSLLIEVGADRRGDPGNAYSPYRQRYYVPHDEIGDGEWHQGEIVFDFRNTPTTTYSIFAARVNEGCPKPGPGTMLFSNVQIISYLEMVWPL